MLRAGASGVAGSWRQPAVVLLAGLFLQTLPAGAWSIGGGGVRRDREREVAQVEQQWRQAELAGDAAALDRVLADDYVGVTVQGKVHTKAQQLRRIRDRALTFERMDLSDVKIRISGEVALVSGRAQIVGSSAGRMLDGRYTYTQVLRQGKNGLWTITNFEARQVGKHREAVVNVAHRAG